MSKFSKTILCSAALLAASISLGAQDRKEDKDRQERHSAPYAYYDEKHRDWHEWNNQEEQSYSKYAEEHHVSDHDFASASERERQKYWSYKHKHSESH